MFSCIIQLSIAFDLKRTLMARPNFDVERNWFREWFFVRSFPALGLFWSRGRPGARCVL